MHICQNSKLSNMRRCVFLMMLLFCILNKLEAQYFNNVNNELCYELYEVNDPLSSYRVYIVIDPEVFRSEDSLLLAKWPSLSVFERQTVTRRLAMEGQRIEAEREPYISYPPVFTVLKPHMIPQKVEQKIDWEKSPWINAKQYWMYRDRPF